MERSEGIGRDSLGPVVVEAICKRYGGHTALAPTSLAFAPHATTVLIGPSGCGKSTLLRIIMGLIQPDGGRVLFGGEPLTPINLLSIRHRIGYVIQDGGLFPHLSSEGNVTLLAGHLGIPAAQMAARVKELAELTRLPETLLKRYPGELSGGQRQRVGLMRALMLDPGLLLLDEPLGALDPITRYELQTQLKDIFARLKKTVLLVTHDMGEAAFLGDSIVLMRDGEVAQNGTLDDLLHRPAVPYVSEFIQAQRSPLTA